MNGYYFYLITGILLTLSYTQAFDKLLQGIPVKKGQFPFYTQLRIGTVNGTLDFVLHCGGSLIHPLWILTAAHCFRKEFFLPHYFFNYNFVVAYMGTEKSIVYSNATTYRYIQMVHLHPQYYYKRKDETRYIQNDIALARLKNPFILNKYIKIINLPRRGTHVCHSGTIIGSAIVKYDKKENDNLEYSVVQSKDASEISMVIGPVRKTAFYSEVIWYRGHPVYGELGGPFICNDNYEVVQYGIISNAYNNSVLHTIISEYESVEKHMGFIRKVLSSNPPIKVRKQKWREEEPQAVSKGTLSKSYSFLSLFVNIFASLLSNFKRG